MTGLAPDRCITCSDEAVEAEVVAVHGSEAIVLVAGTDERVAVDLVPDAAPGDVLLCHAGIALERLEDSRATPQVAQSHKIPPATPQVAQSHKAPPATPQVAQSHKALQAPARRATP